MNARPSRSPEAVRESAKRFVAEGASVAIDGRDEGKLLQAAKEIDPTGEHIIVSAGDIADPRVGAALVQAAVDRFGTLDVLVTNAGVFNPKASREIDEREYDWYLDTILKGKFFTAQAAAKAMQAKGGVIVQTASM